MANIRKVAHGSGFSWRATITSSEGKRRSKSFATKGEASAWIRESDGNGASGSATMTFEELAVSHNRWFNGLVRSGDRGQRTLDGYDSHLHVHLRPDGALAALRLSELGAPNLQAFLDRTIERTGSVETARRLKKSLSAWCAHGERQGWLRGNPAEACKVVAKRRRRAAQLDMPAKADLARLLAAGGAGEHPERDAGVVALLMFGGLRISELLGLADDAAELKRSGGYVHVRERLCSRHVTLGEVKSEDGFRSVPIVPATARALRAWRIRRGPAAADRQAGATIAGRLFPAPPGGRHGGLWSYQDFRRLCWWPLMLRAGLGAIERDAKGVTRPKVAFSPHALRHVFASIQIEQGVAPKRLQALMGHATLAVTMDLYGHLWADPAGDEALAAAAENAIPRLGA